MKIVALFIVLFLAVELCVANQGERHMHIPDTDSMKESGNLGNIFVSVGSVYCWRDWMPIVQKPGPDGGSPLYIKSNLQFDNSPGSEERIMWESYVFDVEAREFHAVQLVDKIHVPKWDGQILESAEKQIELMSHDGPYLASGGEVILVFRFEDRSRRVLWLKSRITKIDRTD